MQKGQLISSRENEGESWNNSQFIVTVIRISNFSFFTWSIMILSWAVCWRDFDSIKEYVNLEVMFGNFDIISNCINALQLLSLKLWRLFEPESNVVKKVRRDYSSGKKQFDK